MKSFIKKSLSLTVNRLGLKNKTMRDLIRAILLTIAIYSGAIAANSDVVNIAAAAICGAACSTFVAIKDKKKYED